MKLSGWAKKQGITYRTAWEHFRTGKIPGAYKLDSGTIIVPDKKSVQKQEFIVTYARVSSSENKSNLESQSKRLIDFCNAKGWQTHLNLKEIGSGLNDKRKKLESVLLKGQATKLVVEHKDRLTRFGVRYIEILCQHIGCELIILNTNDSDKEDLIQDFVSVITSFCARLYGQRRTKRKTEKMIKELCCEKEKKK
ncbi:MAG: IS607 family transposase [Deltaproteobacteria bacterium]|nr:IS607 family transposase [Deltaproteobacteria bacterium]MBW2011831.1 IS607 family transposase [Deltaproteobacteria bacterium]MBW2100678.1 IS607 family transposase [Deltaproteobacteria bacterium]